MFDYYFYKKKVEIIVKGVDIVVFEFGKGVIIEDEFFGKIEVFFDLLSVIIKVSNIIDGVVVKVCF